MARKARLVKNAVAQGPEFRVLLLALSAGDLELTRPILARAGITNVSCANPLQLNEQLMVGAAAVLMTQETGQTAGNFLAEWLGQQPPWSDLPVLILAQASADLLAVHQAMELFGNVTVIDRPVRAAVLANAARSALRARQRQYQLAGEFARRERMADQLDMAMAAAHIGNWEIKVATGEFSASDRAMQLHGFAPGASLNHERALACIHPDDRASLEAALQLTVDSGMPFRHEHRVLQPDGSLRWVSSHAERQGTGNEVRVVGLAQDVTQRKVAELQLKASEERFRLASIAVKGIIFEYDVQTGHVERSSGLYEVLGYQRDEALPTVEWWWELIHPDEREPSKRLIAESASDSYVDEFRMRHKDGRWLYVEERAVMLRGEGGKLLKMVGCTTDVTARRQALAGQQSAMAQIATTLESITDAFTRLDRDWKVVYLNDAAERMNQRPRAETLGKTIWEMFPALVGTQLETEYRRCVDEQVAVEFDYHYLPWDFWVAIKCYPIAEGGLAVFIRDITGVKTTALELQQSQARLQLAVEVAGLGVVSVDYITDTSTPDAIAANLFGLEPGVPVPRSLIHGRFHPDDYAELFGLMERSFDPTGDGTFVMNHRVVRPDGSTRWLSVKKQIVFGDVAGVCRPVSGVLAAVDITDRKQAEQALAERTALLDGVLESTTDVVFVKDLNGRLQLANAVCAAMVNASPEQVMGTTGLELLPPEIAAAIRQADEAVIAGGLPIQLEEAFLVGGEPRVFLSLKAPMRDSSGRIVGLLGISRDITERKRSEESLRDSESRLGGILRRSSVGIVQTDAAGCMTLVNPRWCDMLGYTEKEVLGQTIFAISHASSVAPSVAAFDRLAAGGADYQIEKAYSRKDGSVLHAQSNVAALRSLEGKFLGLIAVVLDISERLRADEELRRLAAELSRADRRKDVFLATLAHELRNPLAPLRNGLQLMKLGASTNANTEQVRAMMDRQLSQLVRLVDDLLDVSRITEGKVELRKAVIDLKAVIHAALETSRPGVEQAGHELTIDLPHEPIIVDGDAARLAQVVSNLLNNSAKYTPRAGRIWLKAWREGNTVVVSVKDNGIGIPAGMIGQVFDMFTQVDRTLERTTGGLGIGLSLVKGLVHLHGGTIDARSEGEGLGSEFVVRLPVAMAFDEVALPATILASEAVPFARLRILVVDDNVDAADSLGALVELLGHEVRIANDGEAGVAVASQFQPNMVLMDIGMPKLNGYEAARQIRQQLWGRTTVLVALTGWGQADDRRNSADAGFDHHLVKPIEMDDLLKLLQGETGRA